MESQKSSEKSQEGEGTGSMAFIPLPGDRSTGWPILSCSVSRAWWKWLPSFILTTSTREHAQGPNHLSVQVFQGPKVSKKPVHSPHAPHNGYTKIDQGFTDARAVMPLGLAGDYSPGLEIDRTPGAQEIRLHREETKGSRGTHELHWEMLWGRGRKQCSREPPILSNNTV